MLSRCKYVWSLPLRTTLRLCSTIRTDPVLDVYRRSIVSKQSVTSEFDSLLAKNSEPSSYVQIFKICGEKLLHEKPTDRVNVLETLWTRLKTKGVETPVELYNSRLRAYLSNRHTFVPSEYLENMLEAGVEPNKETLSLLLHAYCQQKNITGAQQVLLQLKEGNFTITENDYCNLISGYCESGDMSSAVGLLDIMKENGLKPGLPSYSALMAGYAYQGDIEKIKELTVAMKDQSIFPGHGTYCSSLDSLSRGGHHDKLPELLNLIRNKEWMVNEFFVTIMTFAARGELESALIMFDCFRSLRANLENHVMLIRKAAHVIAKQANLWNKPFDSTLAVLNRLQHPGNSIHIHSEYETLLEKTLLSKSWDQLETLLNSMKNVGYPIKPLYIYPPLAHCADSKDIEGIKKWITKYDAPIDQNMLSIIRRGFDSLEDFIAFSKEDLKMDSESTLNLLSVLYNEKDYKSMAEIIRTIDVDRFPIFALLELLSKHVAKPNTSSSTYLYRLEIYRGLKELGVSEEILSEHIDTVMYGLMLREFAHVNEAILFLNELRKVIKILPGTYISILEYINNHLYDGLVYQQFLKTMKDHNIPFNKKICTETLKCCSKSANIVLLKTTMDYMIDNKIDFSSEDYSYIVNAYAIANKPIQALEFYREMKRLGMSPLQSSTTKLLHSLLNIGRLQDALEIKKCEVITNKSLLAQVQKAFIGAYSRRGEVAEAKKLFHEMEEQNLPVNADVYSKLMDGYAYHQDLGRLMELAKEASEKGIDGSQITNSVVDCHINAGDLDKAVNIVVTEKNPPTFFGFVKLLHLCVEKDRHDLAKLVVDKFKILPIEKSYIKHMQLFSLISSGFEEVAIDLAKDIRIDFSMIREFAKKKAAEGNVDHIRSAMKLVRSKHLDPYHLQIYLFNAYVGLRQYDELIKIAQEAKEHKEQIHPLYNKAMYKRFTKESKQFPFMVIPPKKANTTELSRDSM